MFVVYTVVDYNIKTIISEAALSSHHYQRLKQLIQRTEKIS